MTKRLKYYKKEILLIGFIFAGVSVLYGQPAIHFSQYFNNPITINPAFAGSREVAGINLLSRQQWLGWSGSPSSSVLTAHTLINEKNMGLGGSIRYDRTTPVSMTGISGNYSYTISLSDAGKLSMGLKAEINLVQNRLNELDLVDPGDQLFMDDPGIMFRPNFGIGANYVHGNYNFHFSIPRLLNSNLSPPDSETTSLNKIQRIYYIGSDTHFSVSQDALLHASILLGFSRGSSLYSEIAALLWLQERFGFGAVYRLDNTLGFMVKYEHDKQFVFGYSFDVALGLIRYNTGTHEIYIGYKLPFNKQEALSPRKF